MGSQKVGYNWMTELNAFKILKPFFGVFIAQESNELLVM